MTARRCRACNGTGFTDYAWLSIDPCSCITGDQPDGAGDSVVNQRRHKPTPKPKTEKTLSVMTLTTPRGPSNVPAVSTKKVAMRICSRYVRRRPARPVLRSAFFYGRAHREAFGPAGSGNVHRSANSVTPDLQNCSWSKGPLAGTLPFDCASFFSESLPCTSHSRAARDQGGAYV
jgi:hypothetical protein